MPAGFHYPATRPPMLFRSSALVIAAAVAFSAAAQAAPQPAAKCEQAKSVKSGRQDVRCAPQLAAKVADERVLKSTLYASATKLGAKGKYQRAAQHLDQVVARFPTSPVALYTRALAYHNMGNDDAAVRDTTR